MNLRRVGRAAFWSCLLAVSALSASFARAQSPEMTYSRNAPPQWLDPWPYTSRLAFGRFDLFPPQVTYYVPPHPIGHEIVRTGPNGYTYTPVYSPSLPPATPALKTGLYLYPPSWPAQRASLGLPPVTGSVIPGPAPIRPGAVFVPPAESQSLPRNPQSLGPIEF